MWEFADTAPVSLLDLVPKCSFEFKASARQKTVSGWLEYVRRAGIASRTDGMRTNNEKQHNLSITIIVLLMYIEWDQVMDSQSDSGRFPIDAVRNALPVVPTEFNMVNTRPQVVANPHGPRNILGTLRSRCSTAVKAEVIVC